MSLAQRLSTPPAQRGTRTALDDWYQSLSPEDAAAVRAAIVDTGWRHVDLQRELEAEGAPNLADTTFGVWRRRKAQEWA